MKAKPTLFLLFIFLALMFPRHGAFAQEGPAVSPIKNHFDKKKWEEIKKGIDYSGKAPEEKKEKPEKKQPESHMKSVSWLGSPVWKFIFMGLVITILVLLLVRIFGGIRFAQNTKVVPKEYSIRELEENLPEHKLGNYLQDALNKKDYKLATRIYYLMVIQELSDKRIIKWRKEKTNSEYLFEAFKSPLYLQFRSVTLSFDWIWYGEKELNEPEFERLSIMFNQLLTGIKQAA